MKKGTIMRNEYPRPQLVRKEWLNLNGTWEFEFDDSLSGVEKKYFCDTQFSSKINVPFCPESELSGIGRKDFINCVWYRRSFEVPCEWEGKQVILHFGAVDFAATVYVNGVQVGKHRGGYTPFSFNITKYLNAGENYITVSAEDNVRSKKQPCGKQSRDLVSKGCFYTRTTGIWQTVWLEPVSEHYIDNIKITTEYENSLANIELIFKNNCFGCDVEIKAFFEGKLVGAGNGRNTSFSSKIPIVVSEVHLWDIGCGNLYDIEIKVKKDGRVLDEVNSYFGFRSIVLTDNAFLLNGRKVFGRFVLDQGFYPGGVYTAPTDEHLKNDIIYSMQLGFNGARLHAKVFEPRFLYWADKLGYMVWGEFPNSGLALYDPDNIYNFLPEWKEVIKRDYSHPSIIGWCPFNETWDKDGKQQFDEFIGMVYDITKELDATRPVIDASGNYHVRTDIYDIHDYTQDPDEFAEIFSQLDENIIKDQIWRMSGESRQKYSGGPIFVSEYGGILWADDQSEGWGYGTAPKTETEFIERYQKLTEIMLNNDRVLGFCFTQLYDIEQEKNGLLRYDRSPKFDINLFYKINTQKARNEE